ncbi:MAG: cytochrome P450 [Lautropia sp.]
MNDDPPPPQAGTTGAPPQSGEWPSFPFGRTDPLAPPPGYAAARRAHPIQRVRLWNGASAWIVTRHDLIRRILSDDDRFSGRFGQPGFPTVTAARVAVDRGERAFVGMDNPDHDRFRRMFTQEFSVPRMRALEPRIVRIAEDLIDEIVAAGPPQDLVSTLATRFPSLVMSALLGSPYEDHRFIIDCAVARHGLTQTPEHAHAKARELAAYVRRLIDAKEASPGDDLISRILQAHVLPGHLTRDEFAEIGAMILRAGHDTTTNMIGMGTLLILRDDRLRDRLISDRTAIRPAVEEFLRVVSPVQFSPRRVARVDVEIEGTTIRAGDGLFLLLGAGNRDEAIFPQPDAIDIDRANARHIAFGFGIHQCLGQSLARIELQIVFEVLLRRLPTLRLAVPFEAIRFKDDMQIYGVHTLPVTWDRAGAAAS